MSMSPGKTTDLMPLRCIANPFYRLINIFWRHKHAMKMRGRQFFYQFILFCRVVSCSTSPAPFSVSELSMARIRFSMASLTIVAASTTVGTPMAMTGTPTVASVMPHR